MSRKKPKVPKAYTEAVEKTLSIVPDALFRLLEQSAEADWLFSTARLTWSAWARTPPGSTGEMLTSQQGRMAVAALAEMVYQSDELVRRVMAPSDVAQLVANLIAEVVQPGAAITRCRVGLLRLNPDDKISMRMEGGKPIPEGFGDASLDEVIRVKKDLEISDALRRDRTPPSQRGRRRDPHYASEPAFRDWITPYVRSVRKRDGSATKDSVAGEVPTDAKYLGNRCHELTGLDWPAFVKTVPADLEP